MKNLTIFRSRFLSIIFFIVLFFLSVFPILNPIQAKNNDPFKSKESQKRIENLLDLVQNSKDSKQKMEYLDQIILIANNAQLKKSEANALFLSGIE